MDYVVIICFVYCALAASWTSTCRIACASSYSSWTRCPSWALLLPSVSGTKRRRRKMETWSSRYIVICICSSCGCFVKMLYSCIFLFYLKQCILTWVPGELIFLNLSTLRRWALMLFIISSFLGREAAVLLCVAPSSSSSKVSGIHFLSALPNIREAVQRNTRYCYSPAQQGDETNTYCTKCSGLFLNGVCKSQK